MRALVFGLLTATALSSVTLPSQPASAAPFSNASAPLTAEEIAGIKSEAAAIKRKKAAAAKRAREKREAAAAKRRAAEETKPMEVEKAVEAEPVISAPVAGDAAPMGMDAPHSAPIMPDAAAPAIPPAAAPVAPNAALPVTAPTASAPVAPAPAAGELPAVAPAAPAAH